LGAATYLLEHLMNEQPSARSLWTQTRRWGLLLGSACVLSAAVMLLIVSAGRPVLGAEAGGPPVDAPPHVAAIFDDDGPGDQGTGDSDDGDVNGVIVSRPVGPIGTWEIACSPDVICTVETTAATLFERGALTATSGWVEVNGAFNGPVLVAQTLRLDDVESGELVIRLTTGVLSTTFALENELTPLATLLRSANIHLFATQDDDLEEELEEVRQEEEVIWAEPNFVNSIPSGDGFKTWKWGGQEPNGYVNQEAFAQVVLAPAHTVEKGDGMIVAVLDTGLSLSHPAFAGRLVPGRDVVSDDLAPNDDGPGFGWGHGTHIAGIVARIAPEARILPVRVLNRDGRGNTFTLAFAIEWAVLNGADVINLSLGADAESQLLEDTVAWAQQQGVVVVAAAGNDNSSVLQFPAGFANVIGVAAVDGWERKADFSNYGAWVDIAAPGVGITSTVPFSNNGYAGWSGTSMSTAFVSGAAALVRASGIGAEEVQGVLVRSAGSLATTDPEFGTRLGGLLNVARALGLEIANPPPPTGTPPPTPNPTPGPTPQPTPTLPPDDLQPAGYLPLVLRQGS
jgi:thermitase